MPSPRRLGLSGFSAGFSLLVACSGHTPDAPPEKTDVVRDSLVIETTGPTTTDTPVGLALEIENGRGRPLRVRAGQRFFLNQIDVRASVTANVDEGVRGLARSGDFAGLSWAGVRQADQEFVGLQNFDGTFTLRRFFRGAVWMDGPSSFVVTQIDAEGHPTAPPWEVALGFDGHRSPGDSFFVRRLRAIQWIRDCPRKESCAGATQFEEEGLVEARNSRTPGETVPFDPRTTALRVQWSLIPERSYDIAVEQIPLPAYDYGFNIGLEPLTAPGAGGVYPPGSTITFQATLMDGSGNRLHPPGSLPTYAEVAFGGNEAGILYYNAFFDPTTTYYRRKHREHHMMVQIIGPTQKVQPIRSIIDLPAFLTEDDTQVVATPGRDGVYSEYQTFPPANDLFGGAIDPTHAGWFEPVSDTFTFHIPPDAEAGTYLVTMKARRAYLGEDIPRTQTMEIQVGTPVHTEAVLGTGPCNSCHSGAGSLDIVLHANGNRAACAGCHTPLGFELEGPVYVRAHFIHSRSNRFDANVGRCSNCHIDPKGIERTSKSACLSCHTSYPADHVAKYGPIESMYVGGGRESFDQCSTTCHTRHPGSGL